MTVLRGHSPPLTQFLPRPLPSPPGGQPRGQGYKSTSLRFSLTFQDVSGCLHTAEGGGGEDGGDSDATVQQRFAWKTAGAEMPLRNCSLRWVAQYRRDVGSSGALRSPPLGHTPVSPP